MHVNIVSISEKDQEASIQHIWPPRHANPEKTGGQSTHGEREDNQTAAGGAVWGPAVLGETTQRNR